MHLYLECKASDLFRKVLFIKMLRINHTLITHEFHGRAGRTKGLFCWATAGGEGRRVPYLRIPSLPSVWEEGQHRLRAHAALSADHVAAVVRGRAPGASG